MTHRFRMLAWTAWLFIPVALTGADEPAVSTAPEPTVAAEATLTDAAAPREMSKAVVDLAEPTVYQLAANFDDFVNPSADRSYPDEQYLLINEAPYEPQLALRFGWWGLSTSGSKTGVGEWQGLDSSAPFWDIDGIRSNGYRTLDFFATGTENESTQGGLYYYGGPRLTVDLDYDRFIHRFPHPPLGGLPGSGGFAPPVGFYDPPLDAGNAGSIEQPGYVMYGQDLTPNQDYAIRVQQFEGKFKGRLTDNISWGLNVWGMSKEGTRRANSQQHCFNARTVNNAAGNTCHVVSQGQHIDWLTMEVEPVITARFGWLTVEYSRTMRKFEQNDQLVMNDFSRAPPYGFGAGASMGAYAFVPENYTEIDRVKMHAQIAPHTEAYVLGHVGNTHNEFRQSDRKFYGVDARVTNRTWDGLTLVGYGKTYSMNNSPDNLALNTRYPAQSSLWLESQPPQTIYDPDSLYLSLVDRTTWAAGAKSRWVPFHGDCGPASRFAVTSGYEYRVIERQNVTYALTNLVPFTQPNSITNSFFVGLEHDWSCTLNSFVRYRFIDTNYPLVGVTHRAQASLDQAINSNLPAHEDRIEIGGTWTPTDNFMMTASFWIQNTYNRTDFVNFDEDNYPLVVSGWYAPNERWSFNAGYATFSNWISQDITLGREDGLQAGELASWTSLWNYQGQADVINLGGAYAWSPRVNLTGGFEYVRGRNFFNTPPSPPTASPDYSDLPGYSAVRVDTYRVVAGIDYRINKNLGSYVRYNYFDFDDMTMPWNTGTAHMLLGGFSGVY